MIDRFAKYHPAVNFLYFTLVIGFSMALNHPLAQGISLFCAIIYAVQAEGKKAVLFTLKWCLPIMLLTAVMNMTEKCIGLFPQLQIKLLALTGTVKSFSE